MQLTFLFLMGGGGEGGKQDVFHGKCTDGEWNIGHCQSE